MKFICRAALSLCMVSFIFGCGGGGDVPDLGSVEGTVTMDSKPLKDATVTFQPAGGRPSAGRTDENGNYELVYTRDESGALLGKHEVRISTFEMDEAKETVPSKYNDPTTLSATVVAGNNTFDFKLDSKGEIADEGDCGSTGGGCCCCCGGEE